MLSITCKSAIKAVIFLACRYESGVNAGIKEIAEFTNANEHTVGKLLQTLVKQNVINSVKGPSGGFHISKEQLERPIIDIIEAIDGKEVFRQCGLGLQKCSASRPCPIHDQYKVARDIIEQIFTRNKIMDLRDPVNKGMAYLIA